MVFDPSKSDSFMDRESFQRRVDGTFVLSCRGQTDPFTFRKVFCERGGYTVSLVGRDGVPFTAHIDDTSKVILQTPSLGFVNLVGPRPHTVLLDRTTDRQQKQGLHESNTRVSSLKSADSTPDFAEVLTNEGVEHMLADRYLSVEEAAVNGGAFHKQFAFQRDEKLGVTFLYHTNRKLGWFMSGSDRRIVLTSSEEGKSSDLYKMFLTNKMRLYDAGFSFI
jgi:hypothetical protein